MNNLAHVQIERKPIRRPHRNRRQPLVQLVRLALAGRPVQHDIRRGHQFHLVRITIDRVLARIERVHPHALLPLLHQVAVLEFFARLVHALRTHISNHHAHVGNRNVGHRLDLHRRKTRIDEVPPRQHHLFLQSLVPAGPDKRLAVLEHVVPGNLLARDLPSHQRRSILGRHHSHLVVGNLEHLGRGHCKQTRINSVGPRRNNRNLRPALASISQKRPCILK